MKRRGQVWTADFLIGLFLFISVLFIIFKVLSSANVIGERSVTYTDAVHLSSELLMQGYPKNWTNDTAIIPGIALNNRINVTQLEEYKKIPFNRTKLLYHMSSEYIFFFSNGTDIINTTDCTYGYPIVTDASCNPLLTSISYSDLSKVERMVVLNNQIVRMTIYVWQ